MMALQDPDRARGLEAFDHVFWQHLGHSFVNALRAWAHNWSGGLFAPAPAAAQASMFYRQLGRYSSAFALMVDVALLVMGGGLKRHEMISARFGDLLSELYLLSAVLKRWKDEGEQPADFPLVAWCMDSGFATIDARMDEIIANFPSRPAAWLLRFLVQPLGPRRCGPPDALTRACAVILLEPSATRDRLTIDLFHPTDGKGLARLDRAFALVTAVQPLRDRLRNARVYDAELARSRGLIDANDLARLKAAEQAIADVVAVDDFAPEELAPGRHSDPKGDLPSATTSELRLAAGQ
jgi:acyl-CoA dehydrogenase